MCGRGSRTAAVSGFLPLGGQSPFLNEPRVKQPDWVNQSVDRVSHVYMIYPQGLTVLPRLSVGPNPNSLQLHTPGLQATLPAPPPDQLGPQACARAPGYFRTFKVSSLPPE